MGGGTRRAVGSEIGIVLGTGGGFMAGHGLLFPISGLAAGIAGDHELALRLADLRSRFIWMGLAMVVD